MRHCLVVLVCLVGSLSVGCADQLDKDWYALNQSQHQIVLKVVEYERNQMVMIRSMIEKHFDLAEQAIILKEEKTFLDSRTGPDGRLYASDDIGRTVAISRTDVEEFARGAAEARLTLRLKRQEWQANLDRWEEVISKLEESSTTTVETADELLAAKESAQALLDDLVKISTSMGLTAMGFFLSS
jgi:vacuolar-type H+-ATPase subunit I/STV1